MLYLFHSDLEKQKNTLCVYRVGSIFLFFMFIFKKERTAMKDCCYHMFYQKKSCFNLELMDSKIQTTKDIIKKRKKINEFIIKIKHTVIKIGFRELVWL